MASRRHFVIDFLVAHFSVPLTFSRLQEEYIVYECVVLGRAPS